MCADTRENGRVPQEKRSLKSKYCYIGRRSFKGVRIPRFSETNQGEALYIINSIGIAYHQHAVLHLIKPQLIQPLADDIRLRR